MRAERRFGGDVRAAGRELMADVERAVGGNKVISRRELTKAANALTQKYYDIGA